MLASHHVLRAQDKMSYEILKREVELMKEMRSPHIVACHGVQEYPQDHGKVLFYVLMEYCQGVSCRPHPPTILNPGSPNHVGRRPPTALWAAASSWISNPRVVHTHYA